MTSSIEVILLPRARADVRDIFQYTFDTWGSGQHDAYRKVLDSAFERIGVFPDIGRLAAAVHRPFGNITSSITSSSTAANRIA